MSSPELDSIIKKIDRALNPNKMEIPVFAILGVPDDQRDDLIAAIVEARADQSLPDLAILTDEERYWEEGEDLPSCTNEIIHTLREKADVFKRVQMSVVFISDTSLSEVDQDSQDIGRIVYLDYSRMRE